jgi:hypothetical protein
MGQYDMHKRFWLEILKGRHQFEDLDVDGKILKWILKNRFLGCGLDLYG